MAPATTSINLLTNLGMFLFAKLVMENLLRQGTKNDLLREADVLPVDLSDA